MNIPNDPIILLSYTNTKLRNDYPNIELFCHESQICLDDLLNKLDSVGYVYNRSKNQFVAE